MIEPGPQQRFDAESLERNEILLHSRSYDIKTYRVDASTIRMVGQVVDAKPAGLLIADDPEDLHIHDMTVTLMVTFPLLEITAVEVRYAEFPHPECPGISSAYQALVGQSIAAGFSRFVNQTLGRERGCTHVGALLKAMAPVAVQTNYSMIRLPHDEHGPRNDEWTPEQRQRSMAFTLNSCHIWAEDGPYAQAVANNEPGEAPVWLRNRLTKLGRENELNAR